MEKTSAAPASAETWKSAAGLVFVSLLLYYLLDPVIDIIDGMLSVLSMFSGSADGAEAILGLCRFVVFFAPILYLVGLRRFRSVVAAPDAAVVSKLVVSAWFLFAGVVIDMLPLMPGFLASCCRLVAYILMLAGFAGLRKSESFPEKGRRGANMSVVAIWLVIAGWLVGWIPALGDGVEFVLRLSALIFILVGWNRIVHALDDAPGDVRSGAAQPAAEGEAADFASEARGYDDARLAEIVAGPDRYRAELVEACRHEREVRSKAAALLSKVETYTDKKLQVVLAAPRLYSEELVFCAQRVVAGRQRLRAEQEAKAAEEARLEREREEARQRAEQERLTAERRARSTAAWRRRMPYLCAALAAAVVVAAVLYLTSDGYRYRRAVKFAEAGEVDRAIERLTTIDDPTFGRYSSAKYLLYGQYLAKCDSVAAAAALIEAVKARDWADQQAYVCYAAHCLDGTFEPHIRKSKRTAAELYASSPEETDRLYSGALYFELNSFHTARELLEPFSYVGTARGYLGIMYLYGQGGLEQDFETAYDYLKDAPNTLPFVVHKGDLTLYLRKGSYGNLVSVIEAADSFYATAEAFDPGNKAYADRHKVTSQILEAHRKDNGDWWNRGPVYWHYYSFDGGQYTGQYTTWGNSGGAHGWGCYYGSGGKRWIRLGKYARCNNAGLGIDITNSYWISVGTLSGNTGKLVSGVEIAPNGVVTKK